MKRQNFRSDLTLKVAMSRPEDSGKYGQVEIPEHVRLEFFVPDGRAVITAERNGNRTTLCKLSEDKMTLEVYLPLSRRPLGIGSLMMVITEYSQAGGFPDDVKEIHSPVLTGIQLWKGASDGGSSVTVEAELVAWRYGYSAYELAKLHGFDGTEEDFIQWLRQPAEDAAATAETAIQGIVEKVQDSIPYVSCAEVAKLSTNIGRRVLWTGGSITLSAPLMLNAGINEIDFNGAVLTIGALPKNGVSAITGHSRCVIRNLVVQGFWAVQAEAVSNVLDTFAGVENVAVSVSIDGSHYGRGFHICQRLVNCKASIYGTNITAARAYSFCEYLYMCRVGDTSRGTGFYHCAGMTDCDVYRGGCPGKEIDECANYTNVSWYVGDDRKYFSDAGSLAVNGYKLDGLAKRLATPNDDERSAAYVHAGRGGTGVAEVFIDAAATGGTIARRDYEGQLNIYDGHYKGRGCTVEYAVALNNKKQDKTSSDLATKSKEIVSAINEVKDKADAIAVESLRYTPQVLTAAQQLQARKNIGTLSGVTVDLDRLEGVFDDSYTVLEFLQGSDNTAKNKAVCDYIMAQLPSEPADIQMMCSTRADYPAFEMTAHTTDGEQALTLSVFPRLYMIGTNDDYAGTFAIYMLPLSVYGNYLFETPGVGLIDYVRDQIIAMPGNMMPEMFTCYFVKDGTVHQITPSGAARFHQFKPLYLAEHAGDAGAEYSDADKARGREILGCMADDPITSAELEAILK